MTRRPRRNSIPAFKAEFAVVANKSEKPAKARKEGFDVHSGPGKQWRDRLSVDSGLGALAKAKMEPMIDAKTLPAKFWVLALADVFPRRAWRGGSFGGHKQVTDPTVKPGISRQARAPRTSRGSVYCQPSAVAVFVAGSPKLLFRIMEPPDVWDKWVA